MLHRSWHFSNLHVKQSNSIFAIALLASTALQCGTLRAEVFNQDLVFGNSGQSIWQSGSGGSLSYDGLLGPSWTNAGGSIGGVKCRWYGCYGAEVSINTSGNAGLAYSVQLGAGALTLTFPEKISFTTPDPGTIVSGQAFTIQANVTPAVSITLASGAVSTANLQTTGPSLTASVSLQAQVNLSANARGCVVGCVRGSININPGFTQSLLSLDTTQGTLSVLGSQLPQTNGAWSTTLAGGAATINARVPVLNTDSAQGGGWSGTTLSSTVRANVLGLDVSLDRILSTAVGLPPLNGSFGPVNYNILTATAGATLDVQQSFGFTPNLQAALGFTAPVTMLQSDGTYGAASNSANITLAAGLNTFTFQAPGVTSLGVNPVFTLNNSTSNQTSLVVGGSIAVSAGSISAFGKSVGPIFSATQSLGSLPPISLYSTSFTVNTPTITATPFNIGFGVPKASVSALANTAFFTVADMGASPSEDYLIVSTTNGKGSMYEVAGLDRLIATGALLIGSASSTAGSCAAADGLGSGADGVELLCSADGSAIKSYLSMLAGVVYVGDTNPSTTDAGGNNVYYDGKDTLTAAADLLTIPEDTSAMSDAELLALGVTGTVLPDLAAGTDPLPNTNIASTEVLPSQASDQDVPEPATIGILAAALAALGVARTRKVRRMTGG